MKFEASDVYNTDKSKRDKPILQNKKKIDCF